MIGAPGGGNWRSFVRYDEQRDLPQVSRQLLRRVVAYARPYRVTIIVMLLAILVSALLALLPPLLLRDLIDHALPNGTQPGDIGRLNLLALGMIALPLLSGLINVFQGVQSARVGEGIIADLRRDLYDHMQRMALRFFTNTKSGELISRLNNDVIGAQRAVTGTLISIITNVAMVALALTIMISLEWRLTILAVLILPLFIIPSRRVGRVLRRLTRQQLDANGQMNAIMAETLNVSGALLVKLFGRRRDEVTKFRARAVEVRDTGIRTAVINRWFFLGISLASAIGTALVFWVGGYLSIRGSFSTGTLVAFAAYLGQLYGPLSALVNARIDFATSMVSFERVFEVLDLPIEVREQSQALRLEHVQGRVEFQDVSFSYLELPAEAAVGLSARDTPVSAGPDEPSPIVPITSRHWALERASFTVEPGQMAALVGPSGSGKTTITYLLPRLYDPTAGRISLDGHDLRDLSLDTLAEHIGMVTQETYLFHDTIAANLRYARPDATDDQLVAACRAANIHQLIAELPDGYATLVGERGYRLSGGEKQRLAIARVILKDPRILVLDEATSSLDSQSERAIQDALETVMQGRTTLVIAHRLSTILQADTILVLEHGQLVERGTHQELLQADALYARLYATQFNDHVPILIEESAIVGASPAR